MKSSPHEKPIPRYESANPRTRDLTRALRYLSTGIRKGNIPVYGGDGGEFSEEGLHLLHSKATPENPVIELIATPDIRSGTGMQDCAHVVVPYWLNIQLSSGEHVERKVAAKYYTKREPEDRITRVRREVGYMEQMQEAGQPTMLPLAVVVDHREGTILVTEFDDSLLTLDNHPWKRGLIEENVYTACTAAQALAHFQIITSSSHGDSKIKNIARLTDRNSGEQVVRAIDYETAKPFADDPIDRVGAIEKDLAMLIDSLVQKGMFGCPEGEYDYRRRQLDAVDAILNAYMDAWASNLGSRACPATQDEVLEAATEVVAKVEESLDAANSSI